MNTPNKSTTQYQVDCKICLQEIPASETHNAEAEDYFIHYCGLECYEIWVKNNQPLSDQAPAC